MPTKQYCAGCSVNNLLQRTRMFSGMGMAWHSVACCAMAWLAALCIDMGVAGRVEP